MNNTEELFLERIQKNNEYLFYEAYEKNDLKTMNWCFDSGIYTSFEDNHFIDELIESCSDENRLDVLKLLHKYNLHGPRGISFMISVQEGNWEMMKWLYEMGYSKYCDNEYIFSKDLEIMQWLKDRGFKFDKRTLFGAEGRGFVETVKWLKKNI